MIELASYLVGWQGLQKPSIYLHQGRAYVTGLIYNEEGTAVGATIATGLPPAYRPTVDTKVYLPIVQGTTDACNPALNLPTIWPTTIHTDGSWTFDSEVPPSLNTPPPGETWYWDEGTTGEGFPEPKRKPQYTKPFQVELVTGNASWDVAPTADTYPTIAVPGADLTSDFTYTAPTYDVHGNRVHIGGSATASNDGSESLFNPDPPGTTDALLPGGDYSTALLGGEPYPLEVAKAGGGSLVAPSDFPMHPVGDTPPLKAFRGATTRLLRGRISGGWRVGPPSAVPGSLWLGEIETGPTSICPVENAKKEVTSTEVCPLAIEGSFTLLLSLGELLELCLPIPPWCLVHVSGQVRAETGSVPKPCPKHVVGGKELVLGCSREEEANICSMSGVTLYLPNGEAVFPETKDLGRTYGIEGMAKPEASLYKGGPTLSTGETGTGTFDSTLLWSRAQLEAAVTSFSYGFVGCHEGAAFLQVEIQPLYERRQFGIHSGDVLDLSHTGWPGEGAELNIGPSTQGVVPRRRRIVGRAA